MPKESRTGLSENIFSLYIVQITNYLFPLILIPYLTKTLGQAGFGVYSIIQLVITYGQVVIDYGFQLSATGKIASYLSQSKSVDGIFSSVAVIRFVLSIVAIFVAVVVFSLYDSIRLSLSLVVAISVIFVSYSLTNLWLFQAYQQMRLISAIVISTRLISFFLIIFFVKRNEDLILVIWSQAISFLIAAVYSLILSKRYKLVFTMPSLIYLWVHMKEGWPIFQSILAGYIFLNSGLFVLSGYASLSIVGGYAVMEKIARLLASSMTPITQAIYPRISAKLAESESTGIQSLIKKGRIVLMGAFLISLALLIIKYLRITGMVFGHEFEGYTNTFFWFSPWLFLGVLNNLLGVQYLSNVGKSGQYAMATTLSGLIGLSLYFLLIPKYSYLGVPMGIFFGELSLTFLLILIIKLNLDKNKVA